MLEPLIRAMKFQRVPLCARWEALLRANPPSSPLANPEILVFKIPETCDQVLERMTLATEGNYYGGIFEPNCGCGINPLLNYFSAGEKALEEAALRAIHTVPDMTMGDQRHAIEEMHQILRSLKVEEIALFCSVCQLRHSVLLRSCTITP